ncbi:non-ribosomal peptide synthetase [Thermoflavimicrobium dichotomicum]|uniref:Surfactin family lipopeptide synthetase A n=1 Tax=Thermoflavimicrobium dichotomicum TaxID=46223 RepID=A0A1I3V7G5_9BACL|nr:non-ribosomal peptide synthetase [Thermoflavimicrobium dichotomicum]SFJ91368.1 surfactin family lipopeptide synthetase A [Thermoflavimicrobium dichotomicum]
MFDPSNVKDIYRLSPMQKGILFHSLMDQSSHYFEQMTFHLEGTVSLVCLEESLNLLIQKYDILRTIFLHTKVKEPTQVVLKERKAAIDYRDLSHIEKEKQTQLVEELKKEDREKGFDLSRDLLIRLTLLKTDDQHYQLIFSHHHILMDGWCISILLNDLFDMYTRLLHNQPIPREKVTPYSHYIAWLEEQDEEAARAYWKNYLQGYDQITGIPCRTESKQTEYQNEEIYFRFDQELTQQLAALAKKNQVTMNTVFQTIWGILLQKYNNTTDVVFGSVVSGRPAEIPDVEKIVGLFINTIPVRIQRKEKESVQNLLQRVQDAALSSEPYDYLSLAEIQAANGSKQLIDHVVAFENFPVNEGTFQNGKSAGQLGFTITGMDSFEQTNYDLSVQLHADQELVGKLIFNGRVFPRSYMEQIPKHLENIARIIVKNPDIPVEQIEIITEEEKQQLLVGFNQTYTDYPRNKTIQQLFEEQVEKTPEQVALIYQGESMTYQQLNKKSNQLARALKKKGVQREQIVGIISERSFDMIVGLLGILKAGGAYMPIDPTYPADRIEYMLEDSGTQLLIVQKEEMIPAYYQGEVVLLSDPQWQEESGTNLESENTASDLAYIIYTSGSTGKPKGILTTHRNVVRTIKNNGYIEITEDDRILQLSNYAFDGSTFDIYSALLNGAQLVLVSKEELLDPGKLAKLIVQYQITVTFMTTALFNTLVHLDVACFKHMKKILFGGEKVSIKHVQQALAYLGEHKIIHVYGPTETTVFATAFSVDRSILKSQTVPIGKPISNTTCYVVNRDGQLQPIGIPGELCIGGEGLARGYLNRPDLKEERFVANPFVPGEWMYKTGDFVRMLPDGNIEYLERLDDQVKIRGFRIELGEITDQLLQHPQIEEAVVVARTDEQGHSYLCAYLVTDGPWTVAELREHLGKSLPEYMIPSYFVELEKLPLNANGKVDKRALPEPFGRGQKQEDYAAPTNETEEDLVSIWKEILGVEQIGIHDNFFELGGHSLKATMLASRIHKKLNVEIPLRELFNRPTIKQLADYIREAEGNPYASIEPAEKQAYYPLSSAQRRMYMAQQLEDAKGGTSYNIPFVLELQGTLDVEQLSQAFRRLIERHESLRTSFHLVDGKLVQKVHSQWEWNLEMWVAEEEEVPALIDAFLRPFELSEAPLLRAGLIRLDQDRHILMMDVHHIISDGVSNTILLQELTQLYRGEKLPPLRIQYKDYAVWQQSEKQKESFKEQETYWLNQFAGELPVLELPTDYTRPAVQQFHGETLRFEMDRDLVKQLRELSKKEGSTLFITLLAAYNVLLYKYTGQEDLIVGTPVAGRPHADLESIVGVFINTLALRNYPTGNQTFQQFLASVKERVLQAYEYGDYPFDDLIEKLNLQRDLSRHPLFDTMLNLQNMEIKDMELPGLVLRNFDWEYKNTKYDLTWDLSELGYDRLYVSVEYSTSLFKRETIERMAQHFVHLLRQIVANPEQLLSEFELVTEEEKQQLLFTFNQTDKDFPKDKTIHALFEEQVEKTPESVAVVFEEDQLTYRELNARANRLARILREQGVQRENFVGILVDRSAEMIVAILGVLKSGGAYVPLDPEYPVERILYMLEDSGAQLLLKHKHIPTPEGYKGKVLILDELEREQVDDSNLEIVNEANDLAYLIYTSGSTGKPKGVMIEHRGVVNLRLMAETYNIRQGSRVLQLAPISFDASVGDIFHTLLSGASLYIVKKEKLLNGAEFIQWLREKEITSIPFIPPSVLKALPCEDLPHLNTISTSGEALPIDLVKHWGKGRTFLNAYGPTEAVVDATIGECTVEMDKALIGKPIANKKIYILNQHNQLQPVGVTGELCIGGEGLARGYLHRPDLTAERFIPNPYVPGEKIYKTGDLARWLPDGNIEFLGRIDDQVKIRGYRIELGEIETRLLEHPSIKEAVVVARRDSQGYPYLCAYMVTRGSWTVSELREHLSQSLPQYMIPASFMELEKLPLTANGKVDKRNLPEPVEPTDTGADYVAPTDPIQQTLAQIWQEVLGVKQVGIHDNFFDLGGDSIKAIQIAARLNQQNLKLNMRDLFMYPTIFDLTPFVQTTQIESEQGLIKGDVPLTPIQHWFFEQSFAKPHHYNQSMMLFNREGWDQERVEQAFSQLVAHHDALRMRYRQEAGAIIQTNLGLDGEHFTLTVFDLTQETDVRQRMEEEANRLQENLHLSEGPLVRLGLFRTISGDYLLIIIHHLVVDGVSWRILLEDFETLYQRKGTLPAKTSSYQTWASKLQTYAQSKKLLKEAAYWKEIELTPVPALPKDHPGESTYRFGDIKSKTMVFDVEKTKHLLTEAHQAYQTEMNDLLLAALALTIREWTQQNHVAVCLEGHGREEIIKEIDLSRTVGWFTSLYPVIFDLSTNELSSVIKRVKETLRSIPNKGIGYGILKYLGELKDSPSRLQPEISFNYLGQVDQGDSSIAGAPMPMGQEINPDNHNTYALDINGAVVNGQLQMNFLYNPHVFTADTIENVVERYRFYLTQIVDHCIQKEMTEHTPSDFTEKDLTLEELDDVFAVFEGQE